MVIMKKSNLKKSSLIFKWSAVVMLTLLQTACDVGSFTVAGSGNGGTSSPTSALTFGGLNSISNISGNSLQLNWTTLSGAVSYSVFNMSAGTPLLIASVSNLSSSYTVTGLTAGTHYTFLVRVLDTNGLMDANANQLGATTLSVTPPTSLTYSTPIAVYTAGTAITANSASHAGGAVVSYAISPSLPTGLAFNTTTGQITGTPTGLANSTSYTVTATNTGGATTATFSITVNFAGLTSISSVSGTGMQLNWAALPSAASYQIYNLTTGTPVYVTTLVAPATSYVISGLSQSTLYTYRVRASDTSGTTDTNTHDLSATTLAVVATHAGWSKIKSIGSKTPAAQSGLATAPASVTLSWNASTLSSGSTTSYNIYRSSTAGGEDYTSPLATGITTGALTYTDATVSNGTTYYYTITPVVGGVATLETVSADSEVKVIVPPANMALLHRWAANQEMCGLMGRAIDRTQNYSCSYSGPGNVSSRYDVGRSNFVDAYELGCNYTPAPACGDATNGCLGTSDPAGGTGSVNNVYYNRGNGNCWVKTGSATWQNANDSSIASSFRAMMATNIPGLPPLVNLDQNRSYDSCQALSVTGFSGNKKLLTHQQQVIAGAWDSSLSDATISSIENGSSLNVTGNCNSNSGSGLTYDNLTTPANFETLPGTNASGIRSVITGSTSTQNCVSRYGVQDMAGNVWQWSSDQLGTCDPGTHTCLGLTSTLDTTNTDWNGLNFNGTIAPGGGGSNVTEWNFSAMSFSASRFLVSLGLPMVDASDAWDTLAIGGGAGQFNPTKFHGNHFWLYTDNGGSQRGAFAGGGWYDGSQAGRFALVLDYGPAGTDSYIGARCALPAE
jgi:hypothetical protein